MKSYIVDSFTDAPFKGNPAGVCILDSPLDDGTMLSIAKEFNLSETAFLESTEHKDLYRIRYFSRIQEIPLCGHATLASAKVLFDLFKIDEVIFETIQKLNLEVAKEGDDLVMKFPLYDLTPAEIPNETMEALGIRNPMSVHYNEETNIILIEILHARLLKGLSPDYDSLVRSIDDISGILVTAQSEVDEYDFHSRFFWPWSGGNEDPVTGATHTFLAKYWGDKLGKKSMISYQSSERTGFMALEIIDDKTLLIKGKAVIIFEGKLRV
ncbi:MAG: PhzF family phenazine biosynthesis protein [Patiriisocius sp.]|jgi:PhzF family phenazine biosynthesis protein